MNRIFLFLLSILVSGATFAQSDFKILYGPYLQMVSETEASVMWVTNKEATSWVEVAPNDNSHFYAEERPQFYQTNFGKKMIGKLHKVHLTGLKKGTTYRYRIYSKEVIEQTPSYVQYGKVAASNVYTRSPYCFTTLDKSKDETSFVMVNDIHADTTLFKSLMTGTNKQKTDFVLFNGDMVSSMNSEEQIFNGFMKQSIDLFAPELPIFYARGNHETRGMFSTEFIHYFPTSTDQPYYAFRQGPAFFIVLDGGEDKPDNDIEYNGLADFDAYRQNEARWLSEVVNSEDFKQSPFKIVVMHVPPIQSTWHGPIQVKKYFIPILNKAGIDLMLSAHLHSHHYLKKGEDGCEFPILINSNTHVTAINVTPQKLSILIKDDSGKLVKEIAINK